MRVAAYLGVIALGLVPSLAAADVQFGAVQIHKGMCEPSGAIAVPEGSVEGTFVIANDEDNTLRAYGPKGGVPLAMTGGNLDKFLGLDPQKNEDEKADFEGAAWLGGKVYWIGSHSRSRKGNRREARWQLFATGITNGAGKLAVAPSSDKPFNGLLAAIAALDARLADKIRLDSKKEETLAPDAGGFNIEGLAARPDGKSLLIGLRSPLLEGDAVVIPLRNPQAVVANNEKPDLGGPIRINLGGRGIRSLEYSPAAKAYFIVAGPSAGGAGSFDLFTWPDDEKPLNATPVQGFADGLKKLGASPPFQPEALVVDSKGKRLHLFSDDGDTCSKTAPTFRSVAVTLP